MISASHPFCRYAFAPCTHCHETVISISLMWRLCFNVKSLLPSTDRWKCCSNCCWLPLTINQDHLQEELAVMCVLHCIRAECLTLSCRWWGCTAGYAEWSHPAACLSWCRNLQTCRSVEKRTKRKKGTAVSVFANCLWGKRCLHAWSILSCHCHPQLYLVPFRHEEVEPGPRQS